MPDFEIIKNALKAWIRRLHESNNNASWSHIPVALLKRVRGAFLLVCNYDLKICLKLDLPIQFYRDALIIWQMINQHTPENEEQILNEILWNNRFIEVEGFSVYYNNWYNAGVIRIKDIQF